ncbi:hypothetical protein VTO42DRAFT_7620 [Malbranchea cinnamomea]
MLSTGMSQPSSTAAPPSGFRASHPAAPFHAPLHPATATSTVANAAAASTPTSSLSSDRASNPASYSSSTVSSQSVSSSSTPFATHHQHRHQHHHDSSASQASHSSSAPRVSSASMISHHPQRLPDRQRPSLHGRAPSQQDQARHGQTPQQSTPRSGRERPPARRASYVPDQQAPPFSPTSPQLHPTYRSTRSLGASEATSPSRIKVRDLSHIQSFASEDMLASSTRKPGQRFPDSGRQYEISSMPVSDIIEMVAGLLTKITTTNDQQQEHLQRRFRPVEGASNLSPQTTSILAFRGNNVPAITILSYLSRINKYCPTTYEVFLSLLVYFDRMTEARNRGLRQSLQGVEQQQQQQQQQQKPRPATSGGSSANSTPASSTPRVHSSQSSIITPPSSDYADARLHDPPPVAPSPTSATTTAASSSSSSFSSHSSSTVHAPVPTPSPSRNLRDDTPIDPSYFAQYFFVDSYNIHRLVIAGVTCASKFFSDVFYTNSRYAKVGGLPLLELNHLELQFLILNDFRLAIPVEELEAYGTMLVEFYAREVVAQQKRREGEQQRSGRDVDPTSRGAVASDVSGGSKRDGAEAQPPPPQQQ